MTYEELILNQYNIARFMFNDTKSKSIGRAQITFEAAFCHVTDDLLWTNCIGITDAALELLKINDFKSSNGIQRMHINMRINTFKECLSMNFTSGKDIIKFYSERTEFVLGTKEENKSHEVKSYNKVSVKLRNSLVGYNFSKKIEGEFFAKLYKQIKG